MSIIIKTGRTSNKLLGNPRDDTVLIATGSNKLINYSIKSLRSRETKALYTKIFHDIWLTMQVKINSFRCVTVWKYMRDSKTRL